MERKISFPSKIESLRIVEKMIDELSAEFEINSDAYGNILIATLEAANNAILHGNKLDESKEVNVEMSIEKNKLQIIVKDKGPGFDYENIPDPTAPENIENINGRGVFLMEKLSDEMEFRDNGSTVELGFKI
jgi:serine/threonine-protein kinase RsbW